MFPVNIVVSLACLLHLAVAQDGFQYEVPHTGPFGAPVTQGGNTGDFLVDTPDSFRAFQSPVMGRSNTGNFIVDTPDSFNQAGVLGADSLPGVPVPLAVLGNTLPGVPASVPGVPVQGIPVRQGVPANVPGVPFGPGVRGVPVGQSVFGSSFPAVSGQGVLSLPTQFGQDFIGGQGGSFVGGSVLDQTGAGQGAAVGVQDLFPAGAAQAAGFESPSRIVQQRVNPTVTQTVTVDVFETLTDLILNSEPVTLTQFSLLTTTRVIPVAVPTPVNDVLALSTSVVLSPTTVTLTETKSDFRVVVRTSVSYATITHTAYAITHVAFTTTAIETVTVTSPVVTTHISTHVKGVTNYRTVTHTSYVHGGY